MGTATQAAWTAPHFGVQHLESASKRYRATVSAYPGGLALVSLWVPGCGFSPEKHEFNSAAEARDFGERWIAQYASR